VNDNTTSTSVSLEFVNAANQIIRTVNVTLASLASQILTLHVLAPETIGTQGTLAIRGQNSSGAFIVATALRINPSNSFTPIRAFVPKL
jgi:hypothetical protein